MKLILSSILMLITQLSIAQNNNQHQLWSWVENPVDYLVEDRGTQIASNKGDIEHEALKYFLNKSELEKADVKIQHLIESHIGYHISAKQFCQGLPVYGTELKLNIDKKFKIVSASIKTIPSINFKNIEINDWENTVFYDGNKAYGARLTKINDGISHKPLKYIDLSNGITLIKDEARYRKKPKDSLVYVYVYNPDPITSARTHYGGAYKNYNNTDNDSLNKQRVLKRIELKYLSDSFWAENNFVKLYEENNPNFIPANTRTDTFDYNRSQPEFEQVNIIYHITTFRKYLDSLGLDSLANYQIKANPRALSEDQSRFIPGDPAEGKGHLEFGYNTEAYKHVDDAEDADVIIHEFGHAVSYNANRNDLDATSRSSIDEGICDYFACSYSRNISDYEWEKLFNWDGHNEFWEEGRSCVTERTLDDFSTTSNSIYENGEILTGAYMDIWSSLGNEITDKLVLTSLYYFTDNMKFNHAAYYLLDADSALFGGKYHDTICSVLRGYKLVDDAVCELSIKERSIYNFGFWVDKMEFANSGLLKVQMKKGDGMLKVYNMKGQLVFVQSMKETFSISTQTNLQSGVYILKYEGPEGYFSDKLLRF